MINTEENEVNPGNILMSCLDDRCTHDTASLRALGGVFYQIGQEQWCDTATKSWKKSGPDQWISAD